MRLRFGDHEVSTEQFQLTRDGAPVPLQPKALRLLIALLSRAPRAMSYEELTAQLWPSEVVTRNSLTQAVHLARQALGSDGRTLVETVRGFGYRIGAPVERLEPAPPAAATNGLDPFVGRQQLLDTLEGDAREALSGHPRIVLLSGEPGIGKTRTVERLCESDLLVGAEIVWGRCLEGFGAPPLWPWLTILRTLLRARSPEARLGLLGSDAAVLSELSEDLRALVPGAPLPPPLEPERERFRLLRACTRLVSGVAGERPLVVVVDDLHHADSLTLLLLEHLAREATSGQLLVIGAYRHVAAPPNPALDRAIAEIALLPTAGTVATLEGIDVEEVGELLTSLEGGARTERFVRDVHRRTGGNPLFVRGLARQGGSRGGRGSVLPTSVLAVARARLELLEPRSAAVLEAASVVGREFDAPLVAAASDVPVEACLEALDAAFRAGLIRAGTDGVEWRFVHMVVAEAAYGQLAPGRRAQLHLAVARSLEERIRDATDPTIGLVAQHYQRALAAIGPEVVVSASLRAADQAQRVFSFEEAAQHCEFAFEALTRLRPAEPTRSFETLLRLIELYRLSGSRERRLDAGRRAMELARQLGPAFVARAAIGLHDVQEWALSVEPSVVGWLDEALVAVGERESQERAHLLALRAHVDAYEDRARARAVSAKALGMARHFGGDALREALYVRHYLVSGPDHLEEREQIAREIDDGTEAHAASESAVIAFIDTACDQLVRGNAAGAARWRDRALAVAGAHPLPSTEWYLGCYDSGLALLRGDLEEAERKSLEIFEIGRRVGQSMTLFLRIAHQMLAAEQRGDLARAADEVEQARALLPNLTGDLRLRSEVAYANGLVARYSAQCGRRARALEVYEPYARDAFAGIPRDLFWPATIVNFAHAAAALGDVARAAELDALIAPVDSFSGVVAGAVLYAGSLAGGRGRLLETLGRPEEAARAYARALSVETAIGAASHAARARTLLDGLRSQPAGTTRPTPGDTISGC